MACDNIGAHKGATMWLAPFIMKKTEAAALIALLSLRAYVQIINQFLESYAPEDIIAKADT